MHKSSNRLRAIGCWAVLSLCLCAVFFLVIFALFLLFVSEFSPPGEDSWEHYQAGGMFVTSSPSGTTDGRTLVYASPCTGHGDIYLRTPAASEPVRLTNDADFESSPTLTRDCERIAFCREHGGWRHIWIMNADGSQQEQVTHGKALDDWPIFSADGRHLLYSHSETSLFGHGRSVEAYVIRLDTPHRTHLKVGNVAVFSPDGQSVVFTEDQETLWSINLQEDAPVRKRFPSRGSPVGFSPDGRYFLTMRPLTGAGEVFDRDIWVQDLVEETEKRLGVGHSAIFLCEHKCRVLLQTGYDQTPFVYDIVGASSPTRLTMPAGERTFPRLTLDGTAVLLAVFAGTGSPNYDIVSISCDDLQVTTIATVQCN